MVINLERHRDRLQWFLANAKRRNLTVERVMAIDGHDLSPGGESGLSPAEVGCFRSHQKAWLIFLHTKENHCAIFEDDVHLSEDIAEVLKKENFTEGLDLIKLESKLKSTVLGRVQATCGNDRYVRRLLSKHLGSGGYVISRRCAKKLIELSQSYPGPIDSFLFGRFSALRSEFNVYQLIPAACVQDVILLKNGFEGVGFSSEVEAGRCERKKQAEPVQLSFIKRLRNSVMIRHRIGQFGDWLRRPLCKEMIVPFDRRLV